MSKNYRRFQYSWLLILLLGGLLVACHSNRELAKNVGPKLNNKSPKQLSKLVTGTDFQFDWLYLKASAKFKSPTENQSFKIRVKMRKDSVIWMSAMALGVEVSRVLITTDSLQMLDRIHGKYYVGDFEYLSNMIQTDVNFQVLQAMMLGNSMLWDENAKRKSDVDSAAYVLRQFSRRRQRRRNTEAVDPSAELFYTFWIDPEMFRVVKLSVKDPIQNKNLVAQFDAFQKQGDFLFPKKQSFQVTGKESLSLSLEYSKIVVDVPQRLPFKVSQKYERVAQ